MHSWTQPNLQQTRAPGWLNVIALLCLWSALKLIIMGPVSLVLLAAARFHERGRQDVAVDG